MSVFQFRQFPSSGWLVADERDNEACEHSVTWSVHESNTVVPNCSESSHLHWLSLVSSDDHSIISFRTTYYPRSPHLPFFRKKQLKSTTRIVSLDTIYLLTHKGRGYNYWFFIVLLKSHFFNSRRIAWPLLKSLERLSEIAYSLHDQALRLDQKGDKMIEFFFVQ